MEWPRRPDSPLADDVLASPNHDERPGARRPDMLILHYTGMPNAQGALDRLRDPQAKVSAHYLVFEDGRVAQLVPEERRAWHAGAGSWGADANINACSIGIEIVNPGHDGGLPPFPAEQIASVVALAKDIVVRRAIPAERVLAHSDVAPARKQDPGERFPWADLHRAGVGHWVPPAPIGEGPRLARRDRSDAVRDLQSMFARYGYGLAATGVFDEATEHVVTAFQRHFRPQRIDGIADGSTIATLRSLIAALPPAAA